MTKTLGGTHVAVLVAPGLDPRHLAATLMSLRKAGSHAFVVGALDQPVPVGTEEARESETLAFGDVDPARFDALVIPEQCDAHALRHEDGAVSFVRTMAAQHRPIAAIGNGVSILGDADVVNGRRVACDPGVRDELERAGATVSDDELELDGPLITASGAGELEDFCKAVIHTLERRVSAGVRADPAPP